MKLIMILLRDAQKKIRKIKGAACRWKIVAWTLTVLNILIVGKFITYKFLA